MDLESAVSSLELDGGEKSAEVEKDEEDGKEEEQEAWMYLRALTPPDGYVWYIITPDVPTGATLKPMFLKNKHHHRRTACTVVGSRIYVLGGEEDPYFWEGAGKLRFQSVIRFRKVYYADANRRKEGWTEAEEPFFLKQTRVDSYAVTIGGKIFLFNGAIVPELYDPLDKSFSRELKKCPYEIDEIHSHVVLDGGKRILLLDQCGRIYSYDVLKDSYDVYKNGVFEKYHLQSLAVLDGTLYGVGFNLPGLIMSLDLTNPNASLQQVNGLQVIPKLPGADDTYLRRMFLVPLGKKRKMALVWFRRYGYVMAVYRVLMEMHKEESGSIVAKFVSRSKYMVKCGYLLLDILPIFMDPNVEGNNARSKTIKSKEDETGQEEMNKGDDNESAKGNQQDIIVNPFPNFWVMNNSAAQEDIIV